MASSRLQKDSNMELTIKMCYCWARAHLDEAAVSISPV
jgi:hypothetical protein